MTTVSRYSQQTLAATANLANLLPTGTILTFQSLVSSFSNGGACKKANEVLTLSLIFVCAAACFFSSFTDSFVGDDGRLYYGMATMNGLYLFNDNPYDEYDPEKDRTSEFKRKYKLRLVDFVHAVVSLVVFLVFAVGTSDVRRCLLPKAEDGNGSLDILIMNLPVGVGMLASFLFSIFPTRRRGIGCTGTANSR